jgi:antitoxin HicB
MTVSRFIYPAKFEAAEEGGFVVTFADLPEAITQGEDESDALSQAGDCLEEAIAVRLAHDEPIPAPSPPAVGDRLVAVPPVTAAKAALYLAMREAGVGKSELARRMGVDEKEVRRLLDPRYGSKMPALAAALKALGKEIVVTIRDAA